MNYVGVGGGGKVCVRRDKWDCISINKIIKLQRYNVQAVPEEDVMPCYLFENCADCEATNKVFKHLL